MSNPTALDAVVIQDGSAELHGDLLVPPGALGLVIFAHGSGSSRFSRRNREVAAALQSAGLGTLLLDLLTQDEERVDNLTSEYRFDIPRLGRRVTAAADWATAFHATAGLPLGYFGASTGAAAALIAAAARPEVTRAVVSRGGRPDLAEQALEHVKAPTLLIVGGDDQPVIEMNEQARRQMHAPVEMTIVPGASHLFEEPGAMEEVSRRASEWFSRHFRAGVR
ncbi:MAG: dienelactone hydrolase family protein [Vicinamibacterales bacterium]